MANLYSWVIPALLHIHIVMPLINLVYLVLFAFVLLLFCHFTIVLEIQPTNPHPIILFCPTSIPIQHCEITICFAIWCLPNKVMFLICKGVSLTHKVGSLTGPYSKRHILNRSLQ